MINKIKHWFSKSDEDFNIELPKNENDTFKLTVDNFLIGILNCENGLWIFKYSNEFKENKHDYNKIIGFPDTQKVYTNTSLWPFFKVRIPGLKQPAVKEILAKEKIDKNNEYALLKRFGFKTISNPYLLTC